jgi:hypothetical protein
VYLASLFAGSAQSQESSQQAEVKQPETTVIQPKGPEDHRGTDQSPLIVKIAPKTDEERAEEANERERTAESQRKKDKSDDDLATFTEWLFFAAAVPTVPRYEAGHQIYSR